MTYLSLNNVSFSYPNGFQAVKNVNMSFDKGESVAIIGQNGAGKTTTVKMMNGLLKPTEGNIIVDGWDTRDHSTAQISRKAGYVFQNPDDQIFHNDVYSEIEFGPKKLGLSENVVKENVLNSAEIAGITDFLKENPYNLPYSMRKFVTIASVLAMDSNVIILDEPTAGQDTASLEIISDMIKAKNNEGKTIITITHDMEFVANNFERVIVMADCQVIADGNKRDVFWDFDVLNKALLSQPHMSKLANALQIGDKIISRSELIQEIKQVQQLNESIHIPNL
ncbi:energy-coupling factor ABC transporter ATP-binding protein [Virgibacillus sp. W0430]|uniref:energy-coupling factor ABC transporter ATP-binding protein n=1 Tax=Virgibacillus sp. W0430 TaxID=3391580 RepID=UPI003F4674A9